MDFTHKQVGHLYVLETSGRFDVVSGPAFEKEIQKCLNAGNNLILIDMTAVDFINSAGLRSILTAAKAAHSFKGELQFCGLSGIAEEVFKISGFKAMFKTFESIAAATCQ